MYPFRQPGVRHFKRPGCFTHASTENKRGPSVQRERRGTEAREPIPQPAPPSPNEHSRSSPTSPGAKRSIPHVLFLYFAYIYDTLPFQPVFRPAGQKVSSSGLGGSERKSKATSFKVSLEPSRRARRAFKLKPRPALDLRIRGHDGTARLPYSIEDSNRHGRSKALWHDPLCGFRSLSTDPQSDVARARSWAAIYVQDFDAPCVLQFAWFSALCCALHRSTSQVIHRSGSYIHLFCAFEAHAIFIERPY